MNSLWQYVKSGIMSGPDCEAKRYLLEHEQHHTEEQVRAERPIEHVEPIHGWKCECGRAFDLPERIGIGCCPQCKSIHIKPTGVPVSPKTEIVDPGPSGAIVDIITAPLTPQEQAGKDMVNRIKDQEDNPTEPDPLVADDDFFDREERAAMQAEGRS